MHYVIFVYLIFKLCNINALTVWVGFNDLPLIGPRKVGWDGGWVNVLSLSTEFEH